MILRPSQGNSHVTGRVQVNQPSSLVRTASPTGEDRYLLGHPVVDRYLEFVAGRLRPNSLRAVAFDLKTFFSVIEKEPVEVVASNLRNSKPSSEATAG